MQNPEQLRNVLALVASMSQGNELGQVAQLADIAQRQDLMPLRQLETMMRMQDSQSLADARMAGAQLGQDQLAFSREQLGAQVAHQDAQRRLDADRNAQTAGYQDALAQAALARIPVDVMRAAEIEQNMAMFQQLLGQQGMGQGAPSPEAGQFFEQIMRNRQQRGVADGINH